MPSTLFFSSRRPVGYWFWAAVAVSLVVSLTPWSYFLLYLLLPSWLWATAWMLMSVAMLGATLWMTRGR